MNLNITDVVKNLIIINVLVYIAAITLLPNPILTLGLYYPTSNNFHAYQLVSHMFMHSVGDYSHIIFNMLTLFFIGPMVERVWGPKKFLKFYLVCGFGAMVAHLIYCYVEINYFGAQIVPVVGASGAIFGVLIAFAMLFPNMKMMLIFPPIPIKAKYLAMGLIAYDLFSGFGVGGPSSTAHFAHLGGALAGFLIIKFWKDF